MSGVAGIAALLLPMTEPTQANDFGVELKRFVHDDATAVVHFRSFFFDKTNPTPPNNAAWATGGWVGYESGWLFDTLRVGAVGYTSQPFWAPPSTDGTLLLQPGPYGYWVLGQAYASLRFKDQVFTGYRQLIDELEVNPNDDRMTPQTFEAYALSGAFGPVSYFAAYVSKMKGRNDSDFHNMAQMAGAPANVTAGMWLGSLKYAPSPDLALRGSVYHVPDILTSSYGDVEWSVPMSYGVTLRLFGNVMVQGSNGLNLLTGKPFSTWSAGGRAELIWGGATAMVAYTQTGSAANYLTPYGRWLGYTKQIDRDFDRANERAFLVGLFYDFANLNLPGLTFLASATMGNGAINPATGANVENNTEYDLDLTYQVASQRAPDWLKPLQLRARAAYVDENLNGALTRIIDYRFTLNYELTFKGSRR